MPESRIGRECTSPAREHRPAVVISDINMPDINGIELIPLVRKTSPDSVVMMISGNHASTTRSKQCVREPSTLLRSP